MLTKKLFATCKQSRRWTWRYIDKLRNFVRTRNNWVCQSNGKAGFSVKKNHVGHAITQKWQNKDKKSQQHWAIMLINKLEKLEVICSTDKAVWNNLPWEVYHLNLLFLKNSPFQSCMILKKIGFTALFTKESWSKYIVLQTYRYAYYMTFNFGINMIMICTSLRQQHPRGTSFRRKIDER